MVVGWLLAALVTVGFTPFAFDTQLHTGSWFTVHTRYLRLPLDYWLLLVVLWLFTLVGLVVYFGFIWLVVLRLAAVGCVWFTFAVCWPGCLRVAVNAADTRWRLGYILRHGYIFTLPHTLYGWHGSGYVKTRWFVGVYAFAVGALVGLVGFICPVGCCTHVAYLCAVTFGLPLCPILRLVGLAFAPHAFTRLRWVAAFTFSRTPLGYAVVYTLPIWLLALRTRLRLRLPSYGLHFTANARLRYAVGLHGWFPTLVWFTVG